MKHPLDFLQKTDKLMFTVVCRRLIDRMFTVVCRGMGAELVIERLRVRIPTGAAGEFSSAGLTLCADSYSVSVPHPCYRSGT